LGFEVTTPKKSETSWPSLSRWTNAEWIFRHEDKVLLVLTLVIGAIVGLVVVAFILLTENLGSRMYPPGGTAWRRLVLPVAGALITGFLLQRYFPNARGSGIPQTKTALFILDGVIRFRTVLGKFFCSSVSLASGIALGREGPSVHVAAGIASTLGRRLGLSPQRVKSLIPIGSAAALAAAFNTPIAAVLFTLEEVMGDMHAPVLGSIVLSSATSWMVLHLILGDEPLFHVPAYQLVHPIEFAFYALLGAAGGLVSVGFVKLLLWQRKYFLRMPARTRWLQPAVGGLTVGILGLFVPQVLGVGYGFVSQALNGQMVLQLMALLVVLKVVATATCYSSGNAGGIFGPSLFIGAMLGGAFGQSLHAVMPDYSASVGAYALVGMGTAFAGIVRVPLTSGIMIFEMTRDYSIIVPLMISNLMSYFISSRLQPVPIYEALLEQDGIHLPPGAREREELLLVSQACRPATDVLDAGETIIHASSRTGPAEPAWPVVQDGVLLGVVSADKLNTALYAGLSNHPVRALLPDDALESGAEFPHVHPDDTLDTAMRRMARYGLKALPVVSRTNIRDLRAVISLQDILVAYGLAGQQAAAREQTLPENRMTVRALAGTLAAVALAIALATFLNTYYRSERIARAHQDFKDGSELMSRQNFEEAIEKFRSAVSVSHTPEHRLALAEALISAGHLSEAEIYFSELLKEQPASGPANLGIARVYMGQGKITEAVRAYHRAIDGSWTADPPARRLETRLELIEALGKAGRRNLVPPELLALKSEVPQDPTVRRRIGHLFLSYGMPSEATAVFRDLLQSNPDDGESYIGLGEAELALHDLPAAQSAFHNAARREPRNAALQARARGLDEILSMDPAISGIGPAQRYLRSRKLLEAALAALERCHKPPASPTPDPAREPMDRARRILRPSAKPRSSSEAADGNIELARQLWSLRTQDCGAAGPQEQALSQAIEQVSR
jgi:CIC family chloride channel protein